MGDMEVYKIMIEGKQSYMVAKSGTVLKCDAISNIVDEVCVLQNVLLVPEQWCNLITDDSFSSNVGEE